MAVKKTGYIVGGIAGAAIAVAALAGAGMRMPPASAADQPRAEVNSPAAINRSNPGQPMSFADVFDRVSPAVVSINVAARGQATRSDAFGEDPRGRGGDQDEDSQGFGNTPRGRGNGGGAAPPGPGRGGGGDEEEGPRGPRRFATGSGFFISANGYIVTNNHVVEGAEEITVVLKDERELTATVVGRDESTDLAVIKVEGANFPYVTFENAAQPRVGDWVVAIGNPFGLGGTATAGIVSAFGRDIGETFVDFIQIDAPINQGNSGGPTFDVYGRVIGVNTQALLPSGGSVGIGFAIPADLADSITKQLIANGRVTRGYVGATIQNLTPDMAEAMGMPGQKGAVVAELVPGGPAQRAGVQPGDVVVSVNGRAVGSSSEMTREVAKAQAGQVLKLEVIRNGARRTIDVRSGTRPSEAELAQGPGAPGAPASPDGPGRDAPRPSAPIVLGMSLAPLDAANRRQFNIAATVQGVLIDNVRADSDAAEKGLRRGDVIIKAGDRPVTSPADVQTAVSEWKRNGRTSIALLVHRAGRTLYVPIKITN